MRLKTNNESALILDSLKQISIFESKAEIIKLAINLSIYIEDKVLEEYKEDGFEISTNIIFADEKEYYEEIIKIYYDIQKIDKIHYLNLINKGIIILNQLIRESKYDINIFTLNLL